MQYHSLRVPVQSMLGVLRRLNVLDIALYEFGRALSERMVRDERVRRARALAVRKFAGSFMNVLSLGLSVRAADGYLHVLPCRASGITTTMGIDCSRAQF